MSLAPAQPPAAVPPFALLAEAPGRILAVEGPRRLAAEVLAGLAPLISEQRRLYCVDACNRFDAYGLARYARQGGVPPGEFLERVFVTRTFTIHQLQAVVEEMLPALQGPAPGPLLAVLGLDDLFREETLPVGERRIVLRSVTEGLRRLAARGMALLVTFDATAATAPWWRPMHKMGDFRCRAHHGVEGHLELTFSGPFHRIDAAPEITRDADMMDETDCMEELPETPIFDWALPEKSLRSQPGARMDLLDRAQTQTPNP